MKRIYKIILIGASILIIILGVLFWLFIRSVGEIDIPSTLNEAVVDFDELNEKVYFRAKAWGLAGNHEEIILSTSPIDKTRASLKGIDFIFYTSEVYYKRQGIDTLLVYAASSSIAQPPEKLSARVNIVPMELKTNDEIKDYEMNYKKYGLEKLSIYKEQ
jgi:hypothetical protein